METCVFFLLTKGSSWSIASWISLFYFVISSSCLLLLIILVSIMCRVIFKSSKTLKDANIIKKRRHSAIRFYFVTVYFYSWWLVFSGLTFIGHINIINSLYHDILLFTVVFHNMIHLLVTGSDRKEVSEIGLAYARRC